MCNIFRWRAIGLGLCLAAFSEAPADARLWHQGGRVLYPPNVQAQNAYQESLLNRQLEGAEKGLESASKQLSETRRHQALANAEFQKHVRKLQEVTAEVHHEYDNDPKLAEARKQFAAADADYREAREKVMRRLREQSEYRAAVAAHDEAAVRSRSLASEPAESVLRRDAAKELSETMTCVSILEDRVLRADSDAVAAQQRRNEATEELASWVNRQREAQAKDPRLTSAKLSRQRTREALDIANSQLYVAERQALETERVYQSLVQQHFALESHRRANQWPGWPIHRFYPGW